MSQFGITTHKNKQTRIDTRHYHHFSPTHLDGSITKQREAAILLVQLIVANQDEAVLVVRVASGMLDKDQRSRCGNMLNKTVPCSATEQKGQISGTTRIRTKDAPTAKPFLFKNQYYSPSSAHQSWYASIGRLKLYRVNCSVTHPYRYINWISNQVSIAFQ